ncbi:MAG: hypothetical protein K6A81_06355 [Clostridiales bacterium]|nr:hypothetical protein [Clostridiales bacterium]
MNTGDGDSPRPIKYKNIFDEGPQYGEYFKGKTGNAPYQVAPGTRRLEGVHVTNSGVEQPWIAYYDEYGRLIARTDYNAPNPASGIPSTH